MIIEPQIPETGWAKRWLKQSVGLIFKTPHLLLGLACLTLVLGLIKYYVPWNRWGFGLSYTISSFIIGPSALAMFYFMLGKSEGYVNGWPSSEIFKDAIKRIIPLAFLVTPIIVALIPGEKLYQSYNLHSPMFWVESLFNTFYTAYILTWAGPFVFILPSMIGLTGSKNTMLSIKSGKTFKKVWSFYLFFLFGVSIARHSLPWFISLAISLVLLYVLYVAAREMIGGITSNKKQEESVPDGAIQGL